MARIRTYALDTTLTDNDYLLGNDGDNNSIITKRFSLPDLRTFILGESSLDILASVPAGHTVAVNQEGTAIERSPMIITHSTPTNVVNLDLGSVTARYALGTNGERTLTFEDFNLPYYLPSLVGGSITFNTTTPVGEPASTGPFTAGITAYRGFSRELNSAGQMISNPVDDVFVLDAGPTVANTVMTSVMFSGDIVNVSITLGTVDITNNLTVGGDVNIAGNTDIDGTLNVDGTSQFNADVELGTQDPNNDPVDLTVHGNINLAASEGVLMFADDDGDPAVTITNSEGNITYGGNGSITTTNNTVHQGDNRFERTIIIDNDETAGNGRTEIQQGEIIVTNTDGSRAVITTDGIELQDSSSSPLPNQLEVVVGNGLGGTNQGQLSSIQVGDRHWQLPQLSAGVAEALPGLTEDLGGPAANIDLGTFFYGIEQSDSVERSSNEGTLDLSGQSIAVLAGATSVDLGDDGDTAVTMFETFRDATPDGNQLFFIASGDTTTLPAAGMSITFGTTSIFEVIAYDGINNIITFGLLGSGILNISTSTFNVTSDTITIDLDVEDPTPSNFVYYNPSSRELSRGELNVTGRANGATFDGTREDIPVTALDFANFKVITDETSGEITIRQGHNFGAIVNDSTTFPFVMQTWRHYVLDTITTARTVMLPSTADLTVGDSVKIANVSTLDASGMPGATTQTWTIQAQGGQRIMKATTPLVLDDPTASFELIWTGQDAIGWILNGIN